MNVKTDNIHNFNGHILSFILIQFPTAINCILVMILQFMGNLSSGGTLSFIKLKSIKLSHVSNGSANNYTDKQLVF